MDASGNTIKNQEIKLRISLIPENIDSAAVYNETHNLITDDLGLYNIVVGRGQEVDGIFTDIEWQSLHFIKLEYDLLYGEGYKLAGFQEFLSVPYCLYANFVRRGQFGIDGAPGTNGPTGATGAQGPPGESGDQGPKGEKGYTGLPGMPNMPILSAPPIAEQEGTVYLDDGSNREDGLPGFRYYTGQNWIEL